MKLSAACPFRTSNTVNVRCDPKRLHGGEISNHPHSPLHHLYHALPTKFSVSILSWNTKYSTSMLLMFLPTPLTSKSPSLLLPTGYAPNLSKLLSFYNNDALVVGGPSYFKEMVTSCTREATLLWICLMEAKSQSQNTIKHGI